MWLVFILVGLAGQFAWSIENMYLNTYLTYLNFTASSTSLQFNYSLMIAITTAASAVVATLTTIFMGALTDKVGHKKIFISVGYIIWGLATASFGLFNVNSANEIVKIAMTPFTAAIWVVIIDCIMTFFGSTSNDASFNSYVTSNTKDENRGKVEGVLSILSLVSMLVIFVGLNGLTTKAGGYKWDLFFYIIGGLVTLTGVVALFLIPKELESTRKNENVIRIMSEGFKPKTVKANPELYLILLIYFIFATSNNVYFPYLMVYIEKTCQISNNSASGGLAPFAIVMAVALLIGSAGSVAIGFLADKFGKEKMIIPSLGVAILGLLLMFFVPDIQSETARTVFCAIAGLVTILGFVGVPTIINSLIREKIPKGKEGTFMGVRMIFVVALPMCIGPFIGDALNQNLGGTYNDPDYPITSIIPTKWGYIVGIAIMLLTLIPIYFLFKFKKAQKATAVPEEEKNEKTQ